MEKLGQKNYQKRGGLKLREWLRKQDTPRRVKLKPEFPPLLSPGFHSKTLPEMRELCVDEFPLSVRRPLIMGGLESFIKSLTGHQITGKLWVNGSFLTEKIDPDDADLVIEFDVDIYDSGTDLTRALLDKMASEIEEDREYFMDYYYCDPYLLAVFPENEKELYEITERQRKYWIKKFASDRRGKPKGLALVEIGVQ